MTVKEAIERYTNKADYESIYGSMRECLDFRQLAEWLKDYKRLLAQEPKWIPVSERLPKELKPVNITWVNHEPEPYYHDIKDKPFTATGVYFNGQWYWWSVFCTDTLADFGHNYDDVIDDDIEIIAWQPLPEPYKAESEDPDGND